MAVTVTVYVPGRANACDWALERTGRRGVEIGVRRAVAPVDVHRPGLGVLDRIRQRAQAEGLRERPGWPSGRPEPTGSRQPKPEATAEPLFSNVSPTAGTELPVVFWISVPAAVDVERVPAGAGGCAEVDGAAVDLDGRLGIAGRFLDRAVADDQAAAVDDDRRRIRRGLGGHALEDDRARR